AYGATGRDIIAQQPVRIGLMDTGVYSGHPEFDAQRLRNVHSEGRFDIAITNFLLQGQIKAGDPFSVNGTWDSKDTSPPNGRGHATGSAGVIVARRDGVGTHGLAFDAELHAARSGEVYEYSDFQASLDNNFREPKEKDPEIFRQSMQALMREQVKVILGEWQLQPVPNSVKNVLDQVRFKQRNVTLSDQEKADLRQKTKQQGYDLGRGQQYLNFQYEGGKDGKILETMREAAHQGIVHVVAAGNFTGETPHIGAALPYYEPQLEQFWISAVAASVFNPQYAAQPLLELYSSRCTVAKYFCLATEL
ncbi:S8 family serine peptidase, partial [Ralstonia pseudosolanacearum]|uniref:S8 family serine peptidase n=1 Tax=Ralstonia pseudosolanacearum TaxID=1310165 RepID=UPI003D2A9CE0